MPRDPVAPDENQNSPNAPPDPEAGQIEGLDESDDAGLGEYPIDTLLIRKETRTVFDVVRRINAGGFILNPDFQRDFVWNAEKKSKLIESVLMRIPLPVFYLAEDSEGGTIVVDGLQRLSTFRDFLANKFHLKLPHQQTLNKKKFEELSPKLQNRVEDCNLELYLIDSKVPEQAKLDIFERVNSGEVLTRQQMRNCLYMGPATRWLRAEAATDLFLQATGKSLDVNKMRDREFANRFCAFFLLGPDGYKKADMDNFLALALKRMNDADEAEMDVLSEKFQLALRNNLHLFGRHAFRKHAPDQDHRGIINASLWDVMITGLAHYTEQQVIDRAEDLRHRFYQLLRDTTFNASITYGPSSTANVKTRFLMTSKMFQESFGDQ